MSALARRLHHVLEPIHAVTYFAAGCRQAADDLGCKGFWMGYFAFRAAPLGPVEPGPVVAAFSGFAPSMVQRALPDAWSVTTPARCIEARAASAAAALREVGVDEDALAEAIEVLEPVLGSLDPTGRPLAAANQALDLPADVVARAWQITTTLREHRGDGHVALVTAAGLTGLEANVLQSTAGDTPAATIREARGWTEAEWDAAAAGLAARGLDGDGGRALLADIEARTDALAWETGLAPIGTGAGERLAETLLPSARRAASLLRFPNPMALPPPPAEGDAG
jgi:hypothetical protein